MNSGKSAARTVAGKLSFLSWVLSSLLSSIYIFRAENIYAPFQSLLWFHWLYCTHSFLPSFSSCLARSLSFSSCTLIFFWYCLSLSLCCLSCWNEEIETWTNQTPALHSDSFKPIHPYQLLVDPGLEIVAVCTNDSSYNRIITGCAYVKVLR